MFHICFDINAGINTINEHKTRERERERVKPHYFYGNKNGKITLKFIEITQGFAKFYFKSKTQILAIFNSNPKHGLFLNFLRNLANLAKKFTQKFNFYLKHKVTPSFAKNSSKISSIFTQTLAKIHTTQGF